jgi:NhaP-type Na+/H+ or K+/H+ antiporter
MAAGGQESRHLGTVANVMNKMNVTEKSAVAPAVPGATATLALSLPAGPERDTVVALTYGVVVFSILAQGLSIREVTRRAVITRC